MSENERKTPQPPFTMSKYATETDLLRDKCKRLETENAELREAMSKVYLVMAEYDYEGGSVFCAFASKQDADLFASRCNEHIQSRPRSPTTIEDSPENDAAFDAFLAAIGEWENNHPAKDFCGADSFSVRELDITIVGVKP